MTAAASVRLRHQRRWAVAVALAGGHDAATWRALTAPMLEALLGPG